MVVRWRSALLTNIFQRKQEAKNPYVRLVEVNEDTTDPAPWGINWPREYDGYQRTADVDAARGTAARRRCPTRRSTAIPWLKRMFAGYAFAIDYRDRRGHAYMLARPGADRARDREAAARHRACTATRRSSRPTAGSATATCSRASTQLGKMPYGDAHAEVVKTGSSNPVAGGTSSSFAHVDGAHPVALRRLPRSEDAWSCA